MTILGQNLGQVPPIPPASREILGKRVLRSKKEVDDVLKNIKEHNKTLKEKKKMIVEALIRRIKETDDSDMYDFLEPLEKTLDVNILDQNSGSILINAVLGEDLKMLELLLSHPDILVNEKSRYGGTVFECALQEGNAQIVELFLTHPDILINREDEKGKTPLLLAVSHHWEDIVILLLNDPRLDLKKYDQGRAALILTRMNQGLNVLWIAKNKKIRILIEAKMREQGIEF